MEFKLYFLLYILRVLKDTFGRKLIPQKNAQAFPHSISDALRSFYVTCTLCPLCTHKPSLSRTLSLSHTSLTHSHPNIHIHSLTHTRTFTHTHIPSDTPLHSVLHIHMHTYANTFTHLCTHLNVYLLAWFVAILAWDYQNMLYPVYSLDLNVWSGKKRNA